MGQKTNPRSFRAVLNKKIIQSNWFATKKEFPKFLKQDYDLRKFLQEKYKHAGISRIETRRTGGALDCKVFTAKPGVLIGRKGEEIEALRATVEKKFKIKNFKIDIAEIKKPEMDATVVAQMIAEQLERRKPFRRIVKGSLSSTMNSGAKGIKIGIAGRINGAEIAREEWDSQGQVSLQTLKADIDYGTSTAHTTYGKIGVKVMINKGEIETD